MTSKTTTKTGTSSAKRGSNQQKAANKHPEPLSTSSTTVFFKLEDGIAKGMNGDKMGEESKKQIETIRTLLATGNFNRKQELKDALLCHAIKLRRLNRLSNFRNRLERDALAEARQKVEDKYLLLQNLANEISHLRKNIEVCLEFQPSDTNIPLVDVAEFYANAPKELSRPESTKSDPHELHLARLNYEFSERKSMLANLQELEGRKSALLSDIRGKEQRLSQVRAKIGSIKKATNPLLDLLGLKGRHLELKPKGIKKRPMATGGSVPVQLRPLFTNEEACREIFGTSSIELGSDALIRIKEEEDGGMEVEGQQQQEGMGSEGQRAAEDALPTANTKNFFEIEDTLAQSTSIKQFQTKALGCIDFIRSAILQQDGDIKPAAATLLLSRAITLRRLNRLSNFRIASFRARAKSARALVQDRTVVLQNTISGVDYLSKCVERCLDYQSSSDSDNIELIPVEQFFNEVPIALSRPDITRTDAHQLQLARLRHELRTRKSLMSKVQELERKKKTILEQIGDEEKALARLEPRVETLKKTAKPLLDIVGLKSVALSVHNKQLPFRPATVSNEMYRELFGGDGANGPEMGEQVGAEHMEEEEPVMELDDDGIMDIV